MSTPYEQMAQALRDALKYLSPLSGCGEIDELCDRIVGLTELGRCEGEEECQRPAEFLACLRGKSGAQSDRILSCCRQHANSVIERTSPEYTHICENCGCWLPIN